MQDMKHSQCGLAGRSTWGRSCVSVFARHPSKSAHGSSRLHPSKQAPKKKRDISTSFRKGPVPRPLVNTPLPQQSSQDDEDQDQPLIGIPPPASSSAAASLLEAFPFADAYRMPTSTNRSTFEPVVAAAAVTAVPPAVTQSSSLDDLSSLPLVVEESVFGDAGAAGPDALLWADVDPLASLDRVLDGLLLSPILPQPSSSKRSRGSPSSSPSSSSPSTATSSSFLSSSSLFSDTPAAVVQPVTSTASSSAGTERKDTPTATSSSSSSTTSSKKSSGRSSKSYSQSMAAAAAAPAVTVIHCETEYERELEAAAALQQLLVIKVESSQQLLQGAYDPSLRFQTHTNLPPQPNSGYAAFSGASSNGASSSGSHHNGSSTADVLASMGVHLGNPAASSNSNASKGPASSLFGSSTSSSEGLSPVHAWYKQLASKYAHSAAASGRQAGPVRFLSLQSDSARGKAVCRRLGVSAPLAVVLVDAASGRKLQEVCGAKIEQELPNGLLYFGGSDPLGVRTTARLQQITTEAELEALKSSAQLSVVAFHVHAAPPCVRSYARIFNVAQQYTDAAAGSDGQQQQQPTVAFGVMDVDVVPEGAAVSSNVNLQNLPTYVIYHDGQEVARLSSSPDRRQLGEVLAQQVAAAAATSQQPAA